LPVVYCIFADTLNIHWIFISCEVRNQNYDWMAWDSVFVVKVTDHEFDKVFINGRVNFREKTNKCIYELYMLFIDHTYMFRSISATILRTYSYKEYNKKLCVANLSGI
jgi:hypothetical protein